jgi:hypothetical protein
MWRYYAEANICYVYMEDVPDEKAGWSSKFKVSDWFTRGWTLQELIAPVTVEFYAHNWAAIGTKLERYVELNSITKINQDVLLQAESVEVISVAERMSWAAHRRVTRAEDEAYSLLGLFQVNMPMLYGEGQERAFIRLQEAIYNSTLDHSIFFFSYSDHEKNLPLLADSPTRFCQIPSCPACTSSRSKCFPSKVPYTDIVASSNWTVQGHEQIITTVTPYRNEMSTMVPLIEYQQIANELVLFGDNNSRRKISHAIISNQTLKSHPDGAVCILLIEDEGVAFNRPAFMPALLPFVNKFQSNIHKSQIMICPGPSGMEKSKTFNLTFVFRSDIFEVKSWKSKNLEQLDPTQGEIASDSDFHVKTLANFTRVTEIICHVHSIENTSSEVLVTLRKIEEAWSIQEVSELSIRGRRKRVTLSTSRLLRDRCTVKTRDYGRVVIELRRLPAVKRSQQYGHTPCLRYQVHLKHLDISHIIL